MENLNSESIQQEETRREFNSFAGSAQSFDKIFHQLPTPPLNTLMEDSSSFEYIPQFQSPLLASYSYHQYTPIFQENIFTSADPVFHPSEQYIPYQYRPEYKSTPITEKQGEKRVWPCIFKDCKKEYTTGAGLRYHLHNFHNSPSPRFINRPSVLFPCEQCSKSYVTKAGLRYHKSKTSH